MKKRSFILFSLLTFSFLKVNAQFAPQAHLQGSEAIAANDSRIQFWANACTFERGWKDIADTLLGKPVIGDSFSPIGAPGMDVLSLGDGGSAILTFQQEIKNGPGPDFVIFENGFLHPTNDTLAYLELAFVEVSSDGENFFRFPATSLTQDSVQIDNFGWVDASKINNLAGKYINGFGTPFDLEELKDQQGLDVDHITHIKVIDVVGSLNNEYAQKDNSGNKINDPYPSAFPSGGFDLNAIGVLNAQAAGITGIQSNSFIKIHPNPTNDLLHFQSKSEKEIIFEILDLSGKLQMKGRFKTQSMISLSSLSSGIYLIKWQSGHQNGLEKIIKN